MSSQSCLQASIAVVPDCVEVSAAVSGPARVGVRYGHNLIEKLGDCRPTEPNYSKILPFGSDTI